MRVSGSGLRARWLPVTRTRRRAAWAAVTLAALIVPVLVVPTASAAVRRV